MNPRCPRAREAILSPSPLTNWTLDFDAMLKDDGFSPGSDDGSELVTPPRKYQRGACCEPLRRPTNDLDRSSIRDSTNTRKRTSIEPAAGLCRDLRRFDSACPQENCQRRDTPTSSEDSRDSQDSGIALFSKRTPPWQPFVKPEASPLCSRFQRVHSALDGLILGRRPVEARVKRRRDEVHDERGPSGSHSRLQRSQSFCETSILAALNKDASASNLIGDMSTSCCLPLTVDLKHPEIKCISCDTMAQLLMDKYAHVVTRHLLIDCRFPYEFAGGHIQGAVNVYTKEDAAEWLLAGSNAPRDESGRHILVFHCEYSSERAPALYNFLRKTDRLFNSENYPRLCHPEMYMLQAGYKAFFDKYPELCEPQGYRTMLDKEFGEEYRRYRAVSRSSSFDTASIRKPYFNIDQ